MTRNLVDGWDKNKLARSHEPQTRKHFLLHGSDDVGSGSGELKDCSLFCSNSGVWKNELRQLWKKCFRSVVLQED